MVMSNSYEDYVCYPSILPNAVPALPTTITGSSGFKNRPMVAQNTPCLVGMVYPSVYASPTFDLDSLGRLKRLKRLHLQFDTTIAGLVKYNIGTTYRRVVALNTAIVSVVANYNESILPSFILFDPFSEYEARQTVQLAIPLQGYGCDYQFFVTSVGGEPFKLAAYEFDIQPQRDKRYVRR